MDLRMVGAGSATYYLQNITTNNCGTNAKKALKAKDAVESKGKLMMEGHNEGGDQQVHH